MKFLVITGCSGFIGGEIVRKLNKMGYENLILVDDFSDGLKAQHLFSTKFYDIFHFSQLHDWIEKNHVDIDCIFHQGAISATTEWDGNKLINQNYKFTIDLIDQARRFNFKLIYASSAAVYGNRENFKESAENLKPKNFYAMSKLLIDKYLIRNLQDTDKIVGLRYFNVFGMNEKHKGNMASPVYTFWQQCKNDRVIRVFGETDDRHYDNHLRDFVSVDTIVDINIWFWRNSLAQGIFNAGTGESYSFYAIAEMISKIYNEIYGKQVNIELIKFPDHLIPGYQFFTRADLKKIRSVGFDYEFPTIENSIKNQISPDENK